MRWESVPGGVTQWSRGAAHHRLPPESEGDGYRMQHALAAALSNSPLGGLRAAR